MSRPDERYFAPVYARDPAMLRPASPRRERYFGSFSTTGKISPAIIILTGNKQEDDGARPRRRRRLETAILRIS